MKELRTEVEISATPERMWDVLTAFDSFGEWNPFMTQAEGDIEEGARLRVHIEPPGGTAMTFKPRVVRAVAGRELRWLGHLLIPGVFDGEHIFEISPAGDGRTRFVQREEFRGLLVPVLWNSLATNTKNGFEAMNAALKERAEAEIQ